MRFSSIAPLALALAPSLVSADLGFALGTKNVDGSCKSQRDYEADFDAIAQNSDARIVRGYSASDCNCAQNILPAARSRGFQVMLGIWPDVQESFDKDLRAITDNAPNFADQVYAITVGSETLYRGNFTGAALSDRIKAVKQQLPQFKVGTADSWNKYADGTANDVITRGVDILLVNAFAYWQGQPIENATHTYFDDYMQALGVIQSVSNSLDAIEVWNGETGWPSDGGSSFGEAHAGTQNAETYFRQGICGLVDWGFKTFVFEAFDEPWKPDSIGDNGLPADEKHWGVMNADRSPKFGLRC